MSAAAFVLFVPQQMNEGRGNGSGELHCPVGRIVPRGGRVMVPLSGVGAAESVSLETAMAIFDQLANRADIAFAYDADGCYARAHLMCRALEAVGLKPKKAWAFEGSDELEVNKPDGRTLEWRYHVAAALPVKTADGAVQDMVFDPGLFDGPASLAEWGGVMNASREGLQIVPFGLPPKGYEGDYRPAVKTSFTTDESAVETMLRYLNHQGAAPRIVFRSQSRQRFCEMRAKSRLSQQPWFRAIALVLGPYDWTRTSVIRWMGARSSSLQMGLAFAAAECCAAARGCIPQAGLRSFPAN
jgi:hypothetical protein